VVKAIFTIFFIAEGFFMKRTAAERQAAYKKRMREKGFKLLQVWVDEDGFPARSNTKGGVYRKELTRLELESVLVRVTDGTDDSFNLRLYAEIADYAKSARAVWDAAHLQLPLFGQKEGYDTPREALRTDR
jgi:hypothetical protein